MRTNVYHSEADNFEALVPRKEGCLEGFVFDLQRFGEEKTLTPGNKVTLEKDETVTVEGTVYTAAQGGTELACDEDGSVKLVTGSVKLQSQTIAVGNFKITAENGEVCVTSDGVISGLDLEDEFIVKAEDGIEYTYRCDNNITVNVKYPTSSLICKEFYKYYNEIENVTVSLTNINNIKRGLDSLKKEICELKDGEISNGYTAATGGAVIVYSVGTIGELIKGTVQLNKEKPIVIGEAEYTAVQKGTTIAYLSENMGKLLSGAVKLGEYDSIEAAKGTSVCFFDEDEYENVFYTANVDGTIFERLDEETIRLKAGAVELVEGYSIEAAKGTAVHIVEEDKDSCYNVVADGTILENYYGEVKLKAGSINITGGKEILVSEQEDDVKKVQSYITAKEGTSLIISSDGKVTGLDNGESFVVEKYRKFKKEKKDVKKEDKGKEEKEKKKEKDTGRKEEKKEKKDEKEENVVDNGGEEGKSSQYGKFIYSVKNGVIEIKEVGDYNEEILLAKKRYYDLKNVTMQIPDSFSGDFGLTGLDKLEAVTKSGSKNLLTLPSLAKLKLANGETVTLIGNGKEYGKLSNAKGKYTLTLSAANAGSLASLDLKGAGTSVVEVKNVKSGCKLTGAWSMGGITAKSATATYNGKSLTLTTGTVTLAQGKAIATSKGTVTAKKGSFNVSSAGAVTGIGGGESFSVTVGKKTYTYAVNTKNKTIAVTGAAKATIKYLDLAKVTFNAGSTGNGAYGLAGLYDNLPANATYDKTKKTITLKAAFKGSINLSRYSPSVQTVDGSATAKGLTLTGTSAANTLKGGKGNDTLNGNAGANKLYGNGGNDNLIGGSGNDSLYGGAGNDILKGGAGKDVLTGGAGNDKLYAQSGNNTLYGEAGNDTLYGGTGTDTLRGGAGTDTIVCGKGVDKIQFYKGDGKDTIQGGDKNDILYLSNIQNIKSQAKFKMSGKNLVMSFTNNKNDALTLTNWTTGGLNKFVVGGKTYSLKKSGSKVSVK